MDIHKAAQPALTPDQTQALKKLHEAATQFEGVFLQMMMKAMSDTVPKNTIFGKQSNAEQMWSSMLNDERAQAMAKSGAVGIAKILEAQLRATVLSDAKREAHTDVKRSSQP